MDYFFNTGIHTILDAIYALAREQARNTLTGCLHKGTGCGFRERDFSGKESMMVTQGGAFEVGLCAYHLFPTGG